MFQTLSWWIVASLSKYIEKNERGGHIWIVSCWKMAKTAKSRRASRGRVWKKKQSGETDWRSRRKAESRGEIAADRSKLFHLSSKACPIPLPGVTASVMKATASRAVRIPYVQTIPWRSRWTSKVPGKIKCLAGGFPAGRDKQSSSSCGIWDKAINRANSTNQANTTLEVSVLTALTIALIGAILNIWFPHYSHCGGETEAQAGLN